RYVYWSTPAASCLHVRILSIVEPGGIAVPCGFRLTVGSPQSSSPPPGASIFGLIVALAGIGGSAVTIGERSRGSPAAQPVSTADATSRAATLAAVSFLIGTPSAARTCRPRLLRRRSTPMPPSPTAAA